LLRHTLCALISFLFLFLSSSSYHRYLLSFPTRRSSDLVRIFRFNFNRYGFWCRMDAVQWTDYRSYFRNECQCTKRCFNVNGYLLSGLCNSILYIELFRISYTLDAEILEYDYDSWWGHHDINGCTSVF